MVRWNAIIVKIRNSYVLTKEFISKTSLKASFCHAGLSGIFLQEGFPTSGNDIQVALLMTVLVTSFAPLIGTARAPDP